jgi:steroid 5-alpha reductase family enzyme
MIFEITWLPGLLIIGYMTAIFLLAAWKHDNGMADIAWGGGFCLVALGTLTARPAAPGPLQYLITAMTLIWGGRLAWHIGRRSRSRSGEDFRYRAWREAWGRHVLWRSFLQIYLLQGALLLVVALPIAVVNAAPATGFDGWSWLGLGLWLVGLLLEAIADAQLRRFKADPEHHGRLCTGGLWRFCRHPNYFGEALLWWGLWLVVLPIPGSTLALLSPLTITFLLRFVSGVPMLERRYAGDAEFARYRRRTNAFIPWFPKRESPA